MLEVGFERLRLPDGRAFSIDGSLIGMDSNSVYHRSDGTLVAKPGHTTDRLTYLGYGAGAGLLAGVLTGHPLKDTVIGGGLGYLFGSLQKGHKDARDVSLTPGTELGVRLNNRVVFSAYSDQPTSGDRFHRTERLNGGGVMPNGPAVSPNTNAMYNQDAADIGVLIGDKNVEFDSNARPFQMNGATLIPAIPVLRAAGIPYVLDADRNTITATGPSGTVRMSMGSRIALVNDEHRVRMNAVAQRINGTIYVPARFLAQALPAKVTFDRSSSTIVLDPVIRDHTTLSPEQNPGQ